jgi:hypothetical protein
VERLSAIQSVRELCVLTWTVRFLHDFQLFNHWRSIDFSQDLKNVFASFLLLYRHK